MTPTISHVPTTDRLATELAPGVFLLDHHYRGSPGVIASYLIAGGGGPTTLVEAGPASTTETLLAGVRQAGVDPASIERVVVTHVHLDHAGAAGTLLRHLPNARVFVHHVGAPHLADPTKLLASATRIYGDLMAPLWGEVLAVPAERLVALEDGATLRAGGTTLAALDTPGHARHHLALHDAERGLVYTGDVAGVRLDGVPYVRPPTPPPEFEPERWRESIARLRSLAPCRMLLTHYGPVDDAAWHLDELLARVWFWAGWAGGRLAAGEPPAAVTEALRAMEDVQLAAAAAGDPTIARRYEQAGTYGMSVDGIARWWRKKTEMVRA